MSEKTSRRAQHNCIKLSMRFLEFDFQQQILNDWSMAFVAVGAGQLLLNRYLFME